MRADYEKAYMKKIYNKNKTIIIIEE